MYNGLDDDHRNVNLFNNTISADQIKDKTRNSHDDNDKYKNDKDDKNNKKDKNDIENIINEFDNLKTDDTDLFFGQFADSAKMIPNPDISFIKEKKEYIKDDNHYDDKYQDDKYHDDKHHDDKYYDNNHHDGGYNDDKYYDDKYDDHKKKDNDTLDDLIANGRDDDRDAFYDPPLNIQPSNAGPSFGSGPTPSNKYDEPLFASKENEQIAKMEMLRKLGELVTEHKVVLSTNYNMNSDYLAMKYEYDLHRSIRDKKNGVRWLSNLMVNMCWGVEIANENFNPFDFKLKGWSDQINEDVDGGDYYDVLGELYEKYIAGGQSIPPELKLFLLISGSAARFHIAQSTMNSIPSLANNPQLIQKIAAQNNQQQQQQQQQYRQPLNNNDNTKQNPTMDKINKEHQEATRKATDLQMLKDKQLEYQQQLLARQQAIELQQKRELVEKQKQLDELQKQLLQQRSESRSMYSNPEKKQQDQQYNQKPQYRQQQQQQQQQQTSPIQSYPQQIQSAQPTMARPITPVVIKQKTIDQRKLDQLREQQIFEQKIALERQKQYNDDIKQQKPSINMNPDIDNILDEKFNDTESIISQISKDSSRKSKDSSKKSQGSTVSKRKKKKQPIKIDTA